MTRSNDVSTLKVAVTPDTRRLVPDLVCGRVDSFDNGAKRLRYQVKFISGMNRIYSV